VPHRVFFLDKLDFFEKDAIRRRGYKFLKIASAF
jgi:hypothetical protein